MKYIIQGIVSLAISLVFSSLCWSQPPATDAEIEAAYQKRIQKEYLNRVYIPRDLADAFVRLNKLIAEDDKKKFKMLEEEEAVQKLFFSLGRWITYNWGFYGGSRLSHYMKKLGVHHPDDMSMMIIRSYHRYLNKKDLEVKAQLEAIQARQEAELKKRLEKAEILHQETRKRPPKQKTDDGQQ